MDYLDFSKRLGYLSTASQIQNFSQDIALYDILAYHNIHADVKIDPKARTHNRYILTPVDDNERAVIEYVLETARTNVHDKGYCLLLSHLKNNVIVEVISY